MFALRRILLSLAVLAGFAIQASAEPVNVFAAASLKNALDAVSEAWKAEAGNETKNTYAASSALAKQIEQGAPADVFISADLDWMDYVAKKGLIEAGTRTNLLGNKLVLIAPRDSKVSIEIRQGFDLAKARIEQRQAQDDQHRRQHEAEEGGNRARDAAEFRAEHH